MKKVLLTTVMSLMMCMGMFAQDYLSAPKTNEKVLGTITVGTAAWCLYPVKDNQIDHQKNYSSKGRWYETLLEKAKQDYPGKNVDIRGMEVGKFNYASGDCGCDVFFGPAIGKVVLLGGNPETQSIESLSKAMDKALRNVREGSRIAIDMVTISGGISINREDMKDNIIDALLDKGYKVVAKEYLEKLYEEQEAQQSGIYNENTTVKDNNFSAVGYYINVKVTETSLRVQVVNVSTGEYEGNATVSF